MVKLIRPNSYLTIEYMYTTGTRSCIIKTEKKELLFRYCDSFRHTASNRVCFAFDVYIYVHCIRGTCPCL